MNTHPGAGLRAVLTISLLVFALDLVYGVVVSTFSLYVTSLGGSALLIGLLAATVSVTELAGAVSVGSLSDRVGRKETFIVGSALSCLGCGLVALASNPVVLILPRIFFGVSLLATFPVGIAYLADVVSPDRRTLAIAVYVSAQGAGFAVGPLLGGWITHVYGFRTVYVVCAALGVLITLASWAYLPPATRAARSHHTEGFNAFRRFLRGPIFGASVSNGFMLLIANGAVLPFLSLYGAKLGLTTFAIGVLYAARSGASVAARGPASVLSHRMSNATLVLGALVVDSLAAIAIGLSTSTAPLFLAAIVDGVCWGIFMTAGQCIVADEAPSGQRGAAMGVFSAAGALGETAGAVSFGIIAKILGVRAVFFVAGALIGLCAPVARRLLHGRAAAPAGPRSTELPGTTDERA